MSLTFRLTDAGRAALINSAHTGTALRTVVAVGITAQAFTFTVGMTALPAETKRVTTIAGDVVAADTVHVTVRDDGPDTYTVRGFGLYLDNGVLLGAYSQAGTIVEKAAASMLLLAVDLRFLDASSDLSVLQFGDASFVHPPATTERQGVVELATGAETAAGEDARRAVTPAGLKPLLDEKVNKAGDSMMGALGITGDDVLLRVYGTRRGGGWRTRIVASDAVADRGVFLGSHESGAGVFSHNYELNGWAPLYLNTLSGTGGGGGDLHLPLNSFMNGEQVLHQGIFFNRDISNPIDVNSTTTNGIGYVINVPQGMLGASDGALYNQAHNAVWQHQIYGDYRTGQIALRGKSDGVWQPWRTVLDSANFNNHVPTKAGGGASGTWPIAVTGAAGSVPWAGVTGRPDRTNWEGGRAGAFVAGQLSWSKFGNSHTIFDASSGYSPDGSPISNTNPGFGWYQGLPVLMGWNGIGTYGVKVDYARLAETALRANTAGRADSAAAADTSARLDGIAGLAKDVLPWARTLLDNGSDWNAVVDPGSYQVAGIGPNGPVGANPYGLAVVACYGSIVVQNYTTHTGARKWWRSKYNASDWAPWETAAHEGSSPTFATVSAAGSTGGPVPAGAVIWHAAGAPPAGYLVCDGAVLSRSTYARLFGAISGTFGAPDGNTFCLPDLRGVFLRGWDNGRGLDPSRGFGSFQDSQNLAHSHGGWTSADGQHEHGGRTTVNGAHTHPVPGSGKSDTTGWAATANDRDLAGYVNTLAAGDHIHGLYVDPAGYHSHAVGTEVVGGAESRPRNVALLPCIKY